ncbi:SDR family NAD(P)-dependent oxidoreductase [Penaeicola halotolerans]|uniref:SDR family NAD(P)-dependent oxidoreductase n=1 Tax=Penaeicola halotolerans TaxID=2793196 RepID=UPI001CF86B7C|nr:SDR family NAD(P)-dependent oxidoreductase [Penaeicola halotolerans]
MRKIALVTGATSGIGYATALTLSQNGYDIIACGRRAERLDQLAKAIDESADILPLVFDVSDREAVFKSIEGLPDRWRPIDVLVNNAGNAHGLSPIQDGSVDDWEQMIDINVKGLLYVSKAVIPQMVNRRSGHIINIGSIAGKEVYPNGNVYCASKHAVDAINKGMKQDLNPCGVKVTAINPGLVETEFSEVRFKGDKDRAKTVYQGYQALQATDIAETILFVVTRPAHVNLLDITIFPTAQGSATMVEKNLKSGN